MTINGLILGCVLAVLCRTQTVIESPRGLKFLRILGTLMILLLPLATLLTSVGFVVPWQNAVYIVGFSLSVLLLVVFEADWEKRWPLLLVWPTFPLVASPNPLGLWLSIILVEFLLFFAHQDEDKRSDYYKYALLRLLVIFQFFVFDNLFFQGRAPGTGEVFSGLLLGLYFVSLLKVMGRIVIRRPVTWLFLLAYLQFGVLLTMRLWINTYAII